MVVVTVVLTYYNSTGTLYFCYLPTVPNSKTKVRPLITKLKRELGTHYDMESGVEFKPSHPPLPLNQLDLDELRLYAADLMWRVDVLKTSGRYLV